MGKAGRPKSNEPSNMVVSVRFTKHEYEQLKRLAAYHRLNITDVMKKGVQVLQNDVAFRKSSLSKEGGLEDGIEKGQQGKSSS